MRVEVVLDRPIPRALWAEVGEKLAYASEWIRRQQIAADGTRVELALDHPDHEAEAIAAARRTIDALTRGYREIATEVLWRHAAAPANQAAIWEPMRAAGLVHLEARFAPKEAAFKAVGSGWARGVRRRDVEVVSARSGRPALVVRGALRRIAPSTVFHVTLSHSGSYAAAVVVVLAEDARVRS